ncbi:MAG: hypothetical protein K0U98_10895 [Deltaproteobacteria bacterium]|nr:hypothetical protein [Deltaproteobacteria bacterium]
MTKRRASKAASKFFSVGFPERFRRKTAGLWPCKTGWQVALVVGCLICGAIGPLSAQERQPFELEAQPKKGLRAQVATLLVQGGRAGSLATEALVASMTPSPLQPAPNHQGPGSVGEVRIGLLVEVSGSSLLAGLQEGADHQEVDFYAYALTPQGAVSGFLAQTLQLDLETYGERLYEGGLKLHGMLSLPPGTYSLRVLVLEPASGRFGLRTLPLVVPQLEGGEDAEQGGGNSQGRGSGGVEGNSPLVPKVVLMAPRIAEPTNVWLLVQAGNGEEEPAARKAERAAAITAAPHPAEVELLWPEQGALPAAFPVFESEAEIPLEMWARGLSATDLGAASSWRGRLESENSDEVVEVEVHLDLDRNLSAAVAGFERLSGRISLPKLPTATFRLVISRQPTGEDSVDGAWETAPLRVLVLESQPVESIAWSQLESLAASLDGRARPVTFTTELPERPRKRADALEGRARKLLIETLAGGATRGVSGMGRSALVADLQACETRVVDGEDGEEGAGLPSLVRAKGAISRGLAKIDPEALVPLIQLQLELYEAYQQSRNFQLASHSRRWAVELSEAYAAAAATPEARRLAGIALSSVASAMVEAGLFASAIQVLEKALAQDGESTSARLQAARLRERFGDYGATVDELEELLVRNPKAPEGRLRLAVNLRRLRDQERAKQVLVQLVTENNPAWVQEVAYGELAKVLLREKRLEEAVSWLRRALDAFPEHRRLSLLMAYSLDRQSQFAAARQTLGRLAVEPGEGLKASSRYRYTTSTQPKGLEATRQHLLDSSLARQPLFSLAVAALAKKAGERRPR